MSAPNAACLIFREGPRRWNAVLSERGTLLLVIRNMIEGMRGRVEQRSSEMVMTRRTSLTGKVRRNGQETSSLLNESEKCIWLSQLEIGMISHEFCQRRRAQGLPMPISSQRSQSCSLARWPISFPHKKSNHILKDTLYILNFVCFTPHPTRYNIFTGSDHE